jgi:HAD superfamily hydrolase (TIGR01509 family)
MIKAIIFDLDGVLVDTKPLHFEALNSALILSSNIYISWDEHLKIYDGLPTRKKLELLTKNKGLNPSSYDSIWFNKQEETKRLLDEHIQPNVQLINLFKSLRNIFKIFVATNSIRETTNKMLENIGIFNLLDGILTNEDVKHPKPHPEIYLKTIIESGYYPHECLILEDSIHGIKAAQNSCANVMIIDKLKDVTLENIMKEINKIENPNNIKERFPFKGNILIPMAGQGSRFEKAGYVFPKPLIETINGKPMIQLVVESLALDGHYIYLVRQEHLDKYNLKQMLNLITPGCDVLVVDKLTEGACCTTLLAEKLIDNDLPLIIANSDQYIEWNPTEFMYLMNNQSVDGGILTFNNTHPKWSYAKLNSDGFVSEVAEKNPISTNATVGVYYYKHGSDYVKYSKQMIGKNIRVNNEFYVCPVFNEFIVDNKKIKIYDVDTMIGCGTPEDLHNLINLLK